MTMPPRPHPGRWKRRLARAALCIGLGGAFGLLSGVGLSVANLYRGRSDAVSQGAWQEPGSGAWFRVFRTSAGFGRTHWSLSRVLSPHVGPNGLTHEWKNVLGDARSETYPFLPLADTPPRETKSPGFELRERTVCGWPFGCVSYAVDMEHRGCFINTVAYYDLVPLPDSMMRLGYGPIPTRVHWAGVAENALVYGGGIWGAVALAGANRRRLRAKSGRCLRCGYDLQGIQEASRCPECGKDRVT